MDFSVSPPSSSCGSSAAAGTDVCAVSLRVTSRAELRERRGGRRQRDVLFEQVGLVPRVMRAGRATRAGTRPPSYSGS